MSESVLKIVIGDEYKAKVEKVDEFEKSLFKGVYAKAFNSIESILNNKVDEESYEKYNNIVAFVGERGAGKTSAMLTVSNALKDDYCICPEKTLFSKLSCEKSKYSFFDIGVVDPSHFEEKSNLLEIILAKLFKSFKGKIEKNTNRNFDNEKKRKIIKNFETVFDNLNTIANPKKVFEGEAIDSLLKMSASTDLKENIIQLVNSYLEFVSCDKSNNNVLLLEIDDIDLNTKYAFEMVEQIRKYLIIPNVVILMALKLEQLGQVVEKRYREEFGILLDKKMMSNDEPNEITQKYLEKLFPLERTIHIPDIATYKNEVIVKIIGGKDSVGNKKGLLKELKKMIYKRTGLLFLDSQEEFLLPKTLRGLINLIRLLNDSMEIVRETDLEIFKKIFDKMYGEKLKKEVFQELEKSNSYPILMKKILGFEVDDELNVEFELNNNIDENINVEFKKLTIPSNEEKEEQNKNLRLFKNYFLESWCENNLKREYRDFIRKIDERNAEEKNKYVVTTMNKLLKLEEDGSQEYKNIVDVDNYYDKISLGDVIYCLQEAEKKRVEIEDKKLLFAITTIYSLKMYYSLKNNKEEYKKILGDNFCNVNIQNKMRDVMGGAIYYQEEEKNNEKLKSIKTDISFEARNIYRKVDKTSSKVYQLNLYNFLMTCRKEGIYIGNIEVVKELVKRSVVYDYDENKIEENKKERIIAFLRKIAEFKFFNENKVIRFEMENLEEKLNELKNNINSENFQILYSQEEILIINELINVKEKLIEDEVEEVLNISELKQNLRMIRKKIMNIENQSLIEKGLLEYNKELTKLLEICKPFNDEEVGRTRDRIEEVNKKIGQLERKDEIKILVEEKKFLLKELERLNINKKNIESKLSINKKFYVGLNEEEMIKKMFVEQEKEIEVLAEEIIRKNENLNEKEGRIKKEQKKLEEEKNYLLQEENEYNRLLGRLRRIEHEKKRFREKLEMFFVEKSEKIKNSRIFLGEKNE